MSSPLLGQGVYARAQGGVISRPMGRRAASRAGRSACCRRNCSRCSGGLAGIGVSPRDDEHRFSLTPLGATLRTGHPSAHRELFMTIGRATIWAALDRLPEAVATGRTGHGLKKSGPRVPFFDYLQGHPAESAAFQPHDSAVHGRSRPRSPRPMTHARHRLVPSGGGSGRARQRSPRHDHVSGSSTTSLRSWPRGGRHHLPPGSRPL